MNAVKLMGNVGKELLVKDFENNKVASFTLATSESYTNKNNEPVTNTVWHTVVAWGKVAEQCEKIISKGKFVAIEGKIQYRQYKNKEDKTVYVTEILALRIEESQRINTTITV